MHEMAMAEAVVSAARDELKKIRPTARVVRVGIVIGRLHQVVEDNLLSAFEALSRGTALEGATVEIRHIPVKVQCRTCSAVTEIEMPFFTCGRCDGHDVEVVAGNELLLERLEVETDEKHDAKHTSV